VTEPTVVRLGATRPDGIAPAVLALVERGVRLRPRSIRGMRGEVELRFYEDIAPVTISFAEGLVVVEDGPARRPALVISAGIADFVGMTTASTVGGVPNPVVRRGRAAIARVATGRVQMRGRRALGRRLLRLLAL
jgi:hypothetical protein